MPCIIETYNACQSYSLKLFQSYSHKLKMARTTAPTAKHTQRSAEDVDGTLNNANVHFGE